MIEFVLALCAVSVLVGVTSIHRIWARYKLDSDARFNAFVSEAARHMTPAQAKRFFSEECKAGSCRCRHTCAAILYGEPRTVRA